MAAKVPHTGGSPAVLLHYLPRLLELAAEDRLRHPDVELAFGRVALAGGPLAGWPEPERAALRGFFAAFWARRLAAGADDPNPDIDASLCALGLATGDVAPYLEGWLRFEHHHAASHLRAFLERNVGGALAKGRLFNAFWGTPPRQSPCVAVVVGWLRSPATGAAVAAAFDRARNDEEAEALYDAHHLLEGLGPR